MNDPLVTILAVIGAVEVLRGIVRRLRSRTPQQELNMAAIDNLNDAVAKVTAYAASLRNDLANADQTAAINAATDALLSIIPPPAPVEQAPVEVAPEALPVDGAPVEAAQDQAAG